MSNVNITPGSGQIISSEAIGGVEYQRIKIIGGETGSTSVLGVAPDGSMKVSVIGTIGVSVIGVVPVTFAAASNQSVSGTVNAALLSSNASVITLVQSSVAVNIISGSIAASFTPPANQSVSGTVGASIIGLTPVTTTINSVLSMVAPKASIISGVTSVMTGTGLTSVLSAAGTSIKNYVTHLIVTNGAATGTFVDIKDGGGNVLYSGYAAASGGGFVANPVPPIVGSANKSVDAQPRAQASIIVAMTGYTDL
jgi:hypothetical protein